MGTHMYIYHILYRIIIFHHKDIISSQERHRTMKWFDAGAKKMSGSSFGTFIKLIKVQCIGSWGLAQAQRAAHLGQDAVY